MKHPRYLAGAALAASVLAVAGAIGVSAQSAPSTPTPQATATAKAQPGMGKSNEDPTHEATESAEREAAEDSGQGFRGHGGGPNEDATHEANESPEREAAEHAAQPQSAPSTATPAAGRSGF